MEIDSFDYNLPDKLIAQQPVQPRDHARLLVYTRNDKSLADDYFFNISNYLAPKTTLVLNNSKVEKPRLVFGQKEIFVTQAHNDTMVDAMVRPGKKFQTGSKVELTDDISAEVVAILPDGRRRLVFNVSLSSNKLDPYRRTPFPPYINAGEDLSGEYQTVYAKPLGSKAAPTAGLHFTPRLLSDLKRQFTVAEITLHVGFGTFAPLRDEQLAAGRLHEETFSIDSETAAVLNRSTHITAVGTTTLRTLESAVSNLNSRRRFEPVKRTTDIFIRPGYEFKAVDSLITNFHLPKSSLLMLVAALIGPDEIQLVYRHAIKEKYRFYSFGDAMLIL